MVLWNQLVYFQREEGIAFGTQDNLLFSGLTVSSLQCQALWGGETTPVLVRTSFLLVQMVLSFPASGAVPAAFSPGVNAQQEQTGVVAAGSSLGRAAFQNDSPWLILLQKGSEVLQQAVQGVKDSVLSLAGVFLPMGAAFSWGWWPLLRGKLEKGSALLPPHREHSVASLLLQLMQKIFKCIVLGFGVFVLVWVF